MSLPDDDPGGEEGFAQDVTRFTPGPVVVTLRLRTAPELDEQLERLEREREWAVGLTALDGDGCDWGSFSLFVNGDRAWVHLVEGPCFTARDPQLAGQLEPTFRFQDDAGIEHEVQLGNTLSRSQALDALRSWTATGERLPELAWVPA